MNKPTLFLTTLLLLLLTACGGGKKYTYESVPNDPMNARIYTLDNGLTVYLAANRDQPRIHTFVGVRTGGKNDPAETTGLSHYFEHLMFKGTSRFGTIDYEAEKPLLDRIEELFEEYRTITDEAERKELYAEIDRISQEAARYAIPNEYDKLMSAIGSNGTNAFTGYDMTAYVENIPSNEVESWAMIQAQRFSDPAIRLFHTELEAVYEEYNMSLTASAPLTQQVVYSALFPHHPYGRQTILGKPEHLKNPSISNLKKHFANYYIPNNMVVSMAGDLDYDKTIRIIDKYFGKLVPGKVPEIKTDPEKPITQPLEREFTTQDAANVTVGYRIPEVGYKDVAMLEIIKNLIMNGKAGLFDVNLWQSQKTMGCGVFTYRLEGYNVLWLYGYPREGQPLREVADMMLEQIGLLKNGDFDEEMLEAVMNNIKKTHYLYYSSNTWIAHTMMSDFIYRDNWEDKAYKLEYQSGITKQDIVDYCNRYLNDNYVVVYKNQGKVDTEKIDKPQITPIPANRDYESDFLAELKLRETEPIEPVFLDYEKDVRKSSTESGIPILYKKNVSDPTFSLYYMYETGSNSDRELDIAASYFSLLGTPEHTSEELKNEFYKMACTYGVSVDGNRLSLYLSGIQENFDRALELFEHIIANVQPDSELLESTKENFFKSRANRKLSQDQMFDQLRQYAYWGADSPSRYVLSDTELHGITPEKLTDKIKGLRDYEHRIVYYGPMEIGELAAVMDQKHGTAGKLQPMPAPREFRERDICCDEVLLAQYDAKQITMAQITKSGGFDKEIEPVRNLYNGYFGGNMNSIVFQEMREARALAYSASARYAPPSRADRSYYIRTYIATQSDKMADAIEAFNGILNEMPESEAAFQLAKERMIANLRTERILNEDVLQNYIDAEEFGYTTDKRKEIFEKLPSLTLDDVVAFQKEYVKDKPRTYCILGDIKSLDMEYLKKIGPVRIMTAEELFNY